MPVKKKKPAHQLQREINEALRNQLRANGDAEVGFAQSTARSLSRHKL